MLHSEEIWLALLAFQGKDIMFRFIIEYSSLKDFGPLGNNRSIFIRGFLKDDILACVETWEKWTMDSPFPTLNTTWKSPTPKRRKGGSYSPWCNFSLVAWNSILKIGCHYLWPRLIALHKNTLTIELKIKNTTLWAYPNLRWVLILVNPVTWGAILARFSQVSWRALLARLLDSRPRLAWAGLIPPVVDFQDLLE
jgi:hypothetical protein